MTRTKQIGVNVLQYANLIKSKEHVTLISTCYEFIISTAKHVQQRQYLFFV